MRRLTFVAVFVIGTAGSVSNAADVFVDGTHQGASCDDLFAGTELSRPLCTLGAALRRVQPGDRIIVRAGTYRENAVPPIDGTVEMPIVIKSFEGETATVSGAESLSAPGRTAAPDERVISMPRSSRPLSFVQAADPDRVAGTGCPARIKYGAGSWESGRASVRVSPQAAQCEAAGILYDWLAIVREIDLSSRRHVVFEGIRFEDVTVRVSSDGSIALDDCEFASASVTSAPAPADGEVYNSGRLRRGTPGFPSPGDPCGLNCDDPPPIVGDPPLGLKEGGTGARDAENARANIGAAADAEVLHLGGTEFVTGAKVLAAPGIGLDVTQGLRAGSVGIGGDPTGIPGDLSVASTVNLSANRGIYWPTAAPVATRFFIGTSGSGVPLNGQDDNVICRAYNADCSGQKFVMGEHMFKDQLEATYDASAGAGIHEAVEINWDFSPDGSTSAWRPFSMFLDTTANGGDGTAEYGWQYRRGNTFAMELRGGRAAFNRDTSNAFVGRLNVFDRLETDMASSMYGVYVTVAARHPNAGSWWDYVGSFTDATYDASSATSTLGGLYGLRTNVGVAGTNPGRSVNRVVGHEINLTLAGSGRAQNWRGLDIDFQPTGANAVVDGQVSLIRLGTPSPLGPGTTLSGFFGIDIEDLLGIGAWGNAIQIRTQSGGPARGNLSFQGGGWNNGHLAFGTAHVWLDPGTQRLRMSAATPSSATSGSVLVAGTGLNTHGPAAWAADGTSGTAACASMGLTCVDAFMARGSGTGPGCSSTTDFRIALCK